jgi:hypothetical protein
LIRRSFEQKSAFFIARDWDAFRYGVETGNKILPKSPMLVTTADAVEFAGRIPCFRPCAPTTRSALRRNTVQPAARLHACLPPTVQYRKGNSPACRPPAKFESWYDSEYKF